MNIRKNGLIGYGLSALFCLCVICAMLVAPAAAAGSTDVTVTKYCDNNYSAVDDSETINWTYMRDNFDHVVSNGDIYMQGPVFEDEWVAAGFDINDYNVWDEDEVGVNLANYGAHNGTSMEDLLVRVDNMSPGAELLVADSTYPKADRYFSYDNVYNPETCQGDMVLTWWDSVDGNVTSWDKGMRLFFYNENENNFTNWDMHESMSSWYWKYYSTQYPSAKGLSVQTVDTIKIYPAHRYDFATGGDTVEYAYSMDTEITSATNLSLIATDNGDSYQTLAPDTEKASQRFVFDLSEDAGDIEKLTVTWVGTNAGDTDGADLYIWDGSSYDLLDSTSSSTKVTLTGEKTSSISDYVVNGDVTVLVEQKSATDRATSTLATDYVKLVVTHHHSS